MLFNGNFVWLVILFVFVAWIVALSIITLKMVRRYNRLIAGTNREGLAEVLDAILATQKGLRAQTQELEAMLENARKDAKFHVQRVGLVRFNPFSDTGGSQSFTLALLDGHGNGLVMTSLYARTGHRWYIKEIQMGKGKELALSKEEQAAIQKAKVFEGKGI